MKKVYILKETDYNRLLKKVLASQESVMIDEDSIYIEDKHKRFVSSVLSKIPKDVRIITIKYCEFADFSNFDIFEYPNLKFVNLEGTPNNFEEFVDSEAYETIKDSFYVVEK